QLMPCVGGGSSSAAVEGRSSLLAVAEAARRRESVSSIPTIGSVEEDWHDARSVASTFSIMSCFNTSAAVNSTTTLHPHEGDGAERHHSDLQHSPVTHVHSCQHQPCAQGAVTAKVVAEVLANNTQEMRQQGGAGDAPSAAAAAAAEAAAK
ncbi:hypothetical protein VaNZ11_005904, partial [Volvox africanus]